MEEKVNDISPEEFEIKCLAILAIRIKTLAESYVERLTMCAPEQAKDIYASLGSDVLAILYPPKRKRGVLRRTKK